MPAAAPVVATEAAVATTMTAAEIAAAEAAAAHAAQVAAAQTLAAEQAAALAAQQATAATANTAAATATNAATNQSVLQAIGAGPAAPASAAQLGGYGAGAAGGIPTLGAGAGTGANLGYETLAKEVGTGGLQDLLKQPLTNETLPGLSPEISNLTSGAQRIADAAPVIEQTAGAGLKGSMTNAAPLTPDPVAVPGPPNPQPAPTVVVNPGPAPHLSALPEFNATNYLNQTMPGSVPPTPPAPPVAPLYGSAQPSAPPSMGPNTFPDIYKGDSSLYTIDKAPGYSSLNVRPDLAGPSQYSLGNQAGNYNLVQTGSAAPPQEPGGLQSLYKDFMNMPLKDKLMTGMAGSVAYDMLNKPKPYEKEKYKSTFKPGLYSGYTPVQPTPYQPNYAGGGLADLGGYSDGGRMLKGPGDGMSDDIPATIANKQPARLANEEFVIPADVVSHLGNGSSEAGAKQLYKMMERVRKARTGNKKQGKQINPEKYLA
jgi:hypothetical protein